jgi:hypothetical protein
MKLRFFVTLTALLAAVVFAVPASAQPWTAFDSDARYAALGDSISAGYGVIPATLGFPYQIYHTGVVDRLNRTLFAMMAVPGGPLEGCTELSGSTSETVPARNWNSASRGCHAARSTWGA